MEINCKYVQWLQYFFLGGGGGGLYSNFWSGGLYSNFWTFAYHKYHLRCRYLQFNNYFAVYPVAKVVFSPYILPNVCILCVYLLKYEKWMRFRLALFTLDLTEWLELLTASAKVFATVPNSIPASSDTVESERRRMKQY
jgi:hypothetical protein